MAGFFEQAKKAMELRSQMKKMQQELANTTQEYENAGIKVVVNCEFTVVSVSITDPAILDPAHPEKVERTILENTNKALHKAKNYAQDKMKESAKSMGLGGLGGLMG